MSQVCILLIVFYKFLLVYGYAGDVMLVPPFEMRTVEDYPFSLQLPTSRSPHTLQQPILHLNGDPVLTATSRKNKPGETSINNFMEDLNAIQTHPYPKEKEASKFHTDYVRRDSNDSAYRPYNGLLPQSSSPGTESTQAHQKSSSVSFGPAPVITKGEPIKTDLSSMLFKPMTTKMNSKVSSLLSLILAMFSGSSSDGLQMSGTKDLVINGIIKPLLASKGGLKTLISKLSIPLIALLLINLEVLITVWWLWEDCEPQKPYKAPTYSYQKPTYNTHTQPIYNAYNSYR